LRVVGHLKDGESEIEEEALSTLDVATTPQICYYQKAFRFSPNINLITRKKKKTVSSRGTSPLEGTVERGNDNVVAGVDKCGVVLRLRRTVMRFSDCADILIFTRLFG
jgi:hypothetical protein